MFGSKRNGPKRQDIVDHVCLLDNPDCHTFGTVLVPMFLFKRIFEQQTFSSCARRNENNRQNFSSIHFLQKVKGQLNEKEKKYYSGLGTSIGQETV